MQEKQAKRRAACTPDDRGRLAPLPSGKGRGGWESVGLPGWLVQRAGGGLPFLPNLAAVANRCGLFLAWAVELRPGALSGPLWGPRYGVRPKAEGRSPWGCRAGARSAGGGPLAARRSRQGACPLRGGAVFGGRCVFHSERPSNYRLKIKVKTKGITYRFRGGLIRHDQGV